MPAGRLNERTVQEAAAAWLQAQFAARPDVIATTAKLEARVRGDCTQGWGRADGLVAALLHDRTVYTASFEAKSSRTNLAVRPRYRNRKWAAHAAAVALAVALPVAGLVVLRGWPLWAWALPALVAALAVLSFLALSAQHPQYHRLSVVEQAQRYPADEQSVAIPSDLWTRLTGLEKRLLQRNCARRGVGLILVGRRSSVRWQVRPSRRRSSDHPLGYLHCYTRGPAIHQRLLTAAADHPPDPPTVIPA